MSPKQVAIIGAGSTGREAALCGARLGHDVHVYERVRLVDHLFRDPTGERETKRKVLGISDQLSLSTNRMKAGRPDRAAAARNLAKPKGMRP